MKRFQALILVGVMFLLVVVYWAGGVNRDMYAPYENARLVPVMSAEIVTQPTEAASVFLLLKGEMTDWCGDVGEPEVTFRDDLAVIQVALENQLTCDVPRTYEARIPLGTEFLTRGPRYIDVNGYPIEVEMWGQVAGETQFTYDAFTYADYPAVVTSSEHSNLVLSIDSLVEDQSLETWLEQEYPDTPVNFAGHYVVLERTCETDIIVSLPCWHYVIVDSATGRTVQSLEYEGYPAGYQSESRLFVINDPLRSAITTPEEVKFLVLDTEGSLATLRQIATGVASAYDTGTSTSNE